MPCPSILFGAAFTVSVAWALGQLLFRKLRINLPPVEQNLLAGISGAPILSLIIFLLCALDAARTFVFLLIGVAALALNWRYAKDISRARLPSIPSFWKFLFAGIYGFYAIVYLTNSFAPEFSPDGQTYHLGLVYRFFREHGFHRLTTDMYSNMPLGLEMLYLFAFSFGRNSAAATVHCCYLLALPFLMLSYGRRIGKPRAGVCAALIAGLSPVVGVDGVSAYSDVALGVTAFAMFYLLEIWREEIAGENDALLTPIGLLAGFCFAIKLTGFIAPFYAATIILIRKRPRALVPVGAMVALIALPWLIKDWVWLGNPVSPLFNRVFPNPYIHVQFEKDLDYWTHYTLTSFRPWFWTATVSGELGGQIGPLFLLSPLALLALRSRPGRHCLLAALFFLIPYPQNIGARFLIPVVPFVALGISMAFEFSRAILASLAVAAAIFAWPRVIDKYRAAGGGWQIVHVPWKAALRIVPQDVFLSTRSVPWISAQMLDYFVPQGKRVLSTTPVGEAYAKTEVMITYQSAEGDLLQDMATIATRPDLAPAWNLRFTFPKQRLRHLRLVQTAASGDTWSIGEVKIFDGSNRIASGPAWRIDARPFPWDIGLAFDGNPVTRWRSWQALYPGMHVDVDFGAPLEIDRVELHCSHDQGSIEVHPEVCDGGCVRLPATLEKLEDPPYGDLRRLATQQFKQHGIDYLLVDDNNWTAADMSRDPSRWGMEFIAERAHNRLYKLQ
jgi:hypothetical protein